MVWFAVQTGSWLTEKVLSPLELEGEGWLVKSLGFLIAFGARFILFYIYTLVYKNIVLIIMSPMLAFLSERVEELYLGKSYPFHVGQFIKDVLRGIRIAFRNLIRELFAIALATLFLGPLSPIVAFLVESYYYGFSMIDYSNERRKLTVKQSIAYIHRNRGMALGNGLVFYGLFLIPFLGWMVAPALGLVAATLGVLEQNNEWGNDSIQR